LSYQIIAEIPLDNADDPRAKTLLREPRVRPLRFDAEEDIQHFDIRGDFDSQKYDTLWLCEKIVEAGFLNFTIRHSY